MHIDVLSKNMTHGAVRVQPWHYLAATATSLAARGHEIRLISDVPVADAVRVAGVDYCHDPSAFAGGGSWTRRPDSRPADVTIWHTGATSVLTQPNPRVPSPAIAIFTTPLYPTRDFARVAPDVLRSPAAYAGLAIASLIPRRIVAQYLAANFAESIVLSADCARQLAAAGYPPSRLTVLPPGKDPDLHTPRRDRIAGRVRVVFAGNPSSIRGADIAMRAFMMIAPTTPQLHLVMLLRDDRPAHIASGRRLRSIARRSRVRDRMEFRSPPTREAFLQELRAADVLVLPFRLVPSEAPLLPIEAASLGIPVIASNLPSLREVAARGSIFVRAGDVKALAGGLARFVAKPALGDRMRELTGRSDRLRRDWSATAAELEAVILRVA